MHAFYQISMKLYDQQLAQEKNARTIERNQQVREFVMQTLRSLSSDRSQQNRSSSPEMLELKPLKPMKKLSKRSVFVKFIKKYILPLAQNIQRFNEETHNYL